MKLYIAGGCGEHGRNCFLLEDNGRYLMVDCGKGDRDTSFPQLTKDEIMKTEYLFLTHSHKDHSGGIQWMVEQGCRGNIISTKETRIQCDLNIPNWRSLPVNEGSQPLVINQNLRIIWGRSGHCAGSVWYLIEWNGKTILFTGDYKEKSSLYFCDEIRNTAADCAVIDCAYGNRDIDRNGLYRELTDSICYHIRKGNTVLLPVPKYGRGLEMIQLLHDAGKNIPVYADSSLFKQTKTNSPFWTVQSEAISQNMKNWKGDPAVLLVSDPQLRKKENYELAIRILNTGGTVILTGYVYPDTGSEHLLKQKLAGQIAYPVHMNYSEVCGLISKNRFGNIVLNHHAGKIDDEKKITSDIKTGDTVLF